MTLSIRFNHRIERHVPDVKCTIDEDTNLKYLKVQIDVRRRVLSQIGEVSFYIDGSKESYAWTRRVLTKLLKMGLKNWIGKGNICMDLWFVSDTHIVGKELIWFSTLPKCLVTKIFVRDYDMSRPSLTLAIYKLRVMLLGSVEEKLQILFYTGVYFV